MTTNPSSLSILLDDPTIDQRREAIAFATPAQRKSELGQFMTPSIIANFMAGMFSPLKKKNIFLLDAGAGIGSLAAAFMHRAAREKCTHLQCEAWELDPLLHEPLCTTLRSCEILASRSGLKFKTEIQTSDFITDYSSLFSLGSTKRPTHAILNPPYKKISSTSAYRRALRVIGVETTNLYSAFVSLALNSLEQGGELVAITPRSFCNGTYYKPFREFLLSQSAILRIHVFGSRTHAFKGDDVLQENVIFHIEKGRKQGSIILSTSDDATFANMSSRTMEFSEFVLQDDGEKIFHLMAETNTVRTNRVGNLYSHRLEDIGLSVSTGPVVDFRLRNNLRVSASNDCAPLIYAHHFESGFISHPKQSAKKPNFIALNDHTRKWMMPRGYYTVVRRLSSKEERRRIVPAIFDPTNVQACEIGFENHLNVFHAAKKGLPRGVAKGLAVYLGSTFVDQWLRRFSGHTQVNAGDLRALRYPDLETLKKWGETVGSCLPAQEQIDAIVEGKDG
jgi:adenine-specific DNA-methyltransferase